MGQIKAEEYEKWDKFEGDSDEQKYTLTPWGCLSAVLDDYGIDVSHISGRTGTHIVEDFMEDMARCGYVEKVTGDGTGKSD